MPTKPGEAFQWLQSAVLYRDRTTCWEWPFCRIPPRGYGQATLNGSVRPAHAVALILDGKPQPPAPANQALHTCDNPPCVNPDHVRWGTHQDNMDDGVGRKRFVYGQNHPHAKATPEIVRYIRSSGRSCRALGAELGLNPTTVHDILQRKSWRSVA